jgi:hypothetical protein
MPRRMDTPSAGLPPAHEIEWSRDARDVAGQLQTSPRRPGGGALARVGQERPS